jgi:hypothetical protein
LDGVRDFRFASPRHFYNCVSQRRCWVCGETIFTRWQSFVIGPMCAISRTTSEPPCHRDCAQWSARFCPFLSRPHMVRREDDLARSAVENTPGCPILRNPGVAVVWVSAEPYQLLNDGKGKYLIQVGDPDEIYWYAEGREATRAEVLESINSGFPLLQEIAEQDGPEAVADLFRQRAQVASLIPAA